jgi:hypothetical protein
MKHLIVGAGATFAEALALGNPIENCPPLIHDFARKLWDNYTPHPYLEVYLQRIGYPDFDRRDPRILFFELEEKGVTNVEKFIEFVWNNRDAKFPVSEPPPVGYMSGLHIRMSGASYGPERERPATFQCFHENGVGFRNLELTKSVATKYGSGDLVLNLNYDTVFEIALNQLVRPFVYAPNQPKEDELVVCKPHGSMNLVTNETTQETSAESEPPKTIGVAGQIYHFLYFKAGLLIRAGAICTDDPKPTFEAAAHLIGSPELKKISQAYPDTTKKWMTEGADSLNTEVMNDGMERACTHAKQEQDGAEEFAKTSTDGKP